MYTKSGYFSGYFQAASFSFADLRRNKGFLLAKSPFSPRIGKKGITQKEPLFRDIKTGYICAKYMSVKLPSHSRFFFRLQCKLFGLRSFVADL